VTHAPGAPRQHTPLLSVRASAGGCGVASRLEDAHGSDGVIVQIQQQPGGGDAEF
jgi:hypothetical protein